MCHDGCTLIRSRGRAELPRSGFFLGGCLLGSGLLCERFGGGFGLRSSGLLGRGFLLRSFLDGSSLGFLGRSGFGLRSGFLLRRGLLGIADGEDAQQCQRLAVAVAAARIVSSDERRVVQGSFRSFGVRGWPLT